MTLLRPLPATQVYISFRSEVPFLAKQRDTCICPLPLVRLVCPLLLKYVYSWLQIQLFHTPVVAVNAISMPVCTH